MTSRTSHIFAVAEAITDEIDHLTPSDAGSALGVACHQFGINLETTISDDAAMAFYDSIIDRVSLARSKLQGYIAKEADPGKRAEIVDSHADA